MDFGFCDLCINIPEDRQNLKKILHKLYLDGYSTVVLNQHVDESVFEHEKKKRKKGETPAETAPVTVPEPLDVKELLNEFDGKLNILSRLTFAFSDPVRTHSMNQLPVLKKYNLYAVIPKTQAAFQFACSQLNVDIVLIDPTGSTIKLNRKIYLQAVDRGIHFEIQYSRVIEPSNRKLAIYYSHLFFTFGKSRNVIISSGANDESLIRNPYDVINLARLLGLDETKSKYSILQQSQHALAKGEGRRFGKTLFKIQSLKTGDSENVSNKVPIKKIKLQT